MHPISKWRERGLHQGQVQGPPPPPSLLRRFCLFLIQISPSKWFRPPFLEENSAGQPQNPGSELKSMGGAFERVVMDLMSLTAHGN